MSREKAKRKASEKKSPSLPHNIIILFAAADRTSEKKTGRLANSRHER